ncbi:hypothetical protein ES703_27559 [subsurface metagenome]
MKGETKKALKAVAVVTVIAAGGYGLYRAITAAAPPGIELSNLAISPEEVNPGDTVTISCLAVNKSDTEQSRTVIIGGDVMGQKTVILAPGESAVVSFEATPTEVGVYQVSVDGLTGTFTVTEAPVARIVLSNLIIQPGEVNIGELVTISVTATNEGNAAGSKVVTCTIT